MYVAASRFRLREDGKIIKSNTIHIHPFGMISNKTVVCIEALPIQTTNTNQYDHGIPSKF